MASYCSIPPWILSVPLTAALTSRSRWSPPLSSSLPHLRASLPGRLLKTHLQSGPSPQPHRRQPRQHSPAQRPSLTLGPCTSRLPLSGLCSGIFSSKKMPPTLTSPGKCHFCLSGIISTLWALHSGPECSFPRCPGWTV